MTIKYWDQIEYDKWQNLVEHCDYATFYHTPTWHNLVQQSTPGSVVKTIGGRLDNGTEFVLPMITTRKMGPVHGLVSSAENVYGGIIANGPITDDERRTIYMDIAKKWSVISFNFSPAASKQFDLGLAAYLPSPDKTYLVSLDQDAETIYKNYSRGHKSAIKKARKAGVVVSVTENIDDYRAYHEAYLDSLDRWGDTIMGDFTSWEMFERIHALALTMPETIKLWVGYLDGQVISGALIFYWNKSVVYYHGANHREYFNYRAANLIQHEIMTHAAEANMGYETYDFGPSGVSEGVSEFKRRFGGKEQPSPGGFTHIRSHWHCKRSATGSRASRFTAQQLHTDRQLAYANLRAGLTDLQVDVALCIHPILRPSSVHKRALHLKMGSDTLNRCP